MTRRNHCAQCLDEDYVGDWDPICSKCLRSLHHYCATYYDALSTIYIVKSRIRNNYKPHYKVYANELITIFEFLLSNEFIEYITKELDDYYDDNLKEDQQKITEKLRVLYEKYKDFPSDTLLELDDAKIFRGCLFDIDAFEDLEFKCFMCHKEVEIRY